MRKIFHGVLAALLIMSPASAKTYSDKTFLMPRSHGMNMAMEYTTWHKQTAMIDDNKFGGTIQATFFYDQSENKKDLGKYFGTSNYLNGCRIEDFFTVVPLFDDPKTPQPKHQQAAFIFHSPNFVDTGTSNDAGLTLADKITWRPDRESYGVTLNYHQKLDKILKGLFFKVTLPIVHVKTSMHYSSSCGRCPTKCPTDCPTPCKGGGCPTTGCPTTGCDTKCTSSCTVQKLEKGGTLSGTAFSLADYLTGCVKNDDADAKQARLCRAKIHNGNSETGIADIDIMLGYNFLYESNRHVNVSVGLTIPTGNTPNGEFLWEAIVGNAGHWALGAGFDSAFELWKDEDMSLDFIFAFNYRYLFSSTERRTMGFVYPSSFKSLAGKRAIYGRWLLGAKAKDKITTPLANFLTQDLKITPGSHFDGIVQLAFNYNYWTFDIGYNLYAREADNVRLSCCPTKDCPTTDGCPTDGCDDVCPVTCGWADDTYGIANPQWITTNEFDPKDGGTTIFGGPIQIKDLCLDAPLQPSVITHKIYGGIGYSYNSWDYPLLLGIGGSYEFETDNDSLEVWSLWAKAGITF